MQQQSIDNLDVKVVEVQSEANIAARTITPGVRKRIIYRGMSFNTMI